MKTTMPQPRSLDEDALKKFLGEENSESSPQPSAPFLPVKTIPDPKPSRKPVNRTSEKKGRVGRPGSKVIASGNYVKSTLPLDRNLHAWLVGEASRRQTNLIDLVNDLLTDKMGGG